MYEMGWGVTQDKQKALEFYKQSVDKGNERAKDNIERLTASLGKTEEPAAPAEPKPAEGQVTRPPATVDTGVAPKSDSSDAGAAPVAEAPEGGVKTDSSAN